MARAKSPEKRHAILRATIREIAHSGLGASTASIAKAANVAEGTIFTYFASKEALLNELYIEVKSEAYRRINADFPHDAALRERARHIWTRYLQWAIEKPDDRKASTLLNLSAVVSEKSRDQVGDQRVEIARTLDEVGKRGAFTDLPAGFASSAMSAMQEAVLETISRKPRQKAALIERTFDAFWRMAK